MPAKNELNEALKAGIEADEQSRVRVRRFVDRAMRQAEELLITGSPDVQAQLIKSVVPAMVKALEQREDDDVSDVREEFREFMAEMRSGVGGIKQLETQVEDDSENGLIKDTPRKRLKVVESDG